MWKIDTYKKKNIEANYISKKHGKYYPTFYLKTCVHILMEMLGSCFILDCREFRYFRYIDLNVNKAKLSYKNKSCLVDNKREYALSITG